MYSTVSKKKRKGGSMEKESNKAHMWVPCNMNTNALFWQVTATGDSRRVSGLWWWGLLYWDTSMWKKKIAWTLHHNYIKVYFIIIICCHIPCIIIPLNIWRELLFTFKNRILYVISLKPLSLSITFILADTSKENCSYNSSNENNTWNRCRNRNHCIGQ